MIVIAILAAAAAPTDFGVRELSESAPVVGISRSNSGDRKSAHAFQCRVRSVTDGDTFRCTTGLRIRLSAIDTPEMGSCRQGRKCAPGDPYAAKAQLARLIDGATVTCESVGKSYNRIAAWCSVGGRDLSCAMLSGGHAIRLPQHDRAGRLRRC